MRMISTYLENAIRFERLAAQESDPAFKTEFGKQAISLSKAGRGTRESLSIPKELRRKGYSFRGKLFQTRNALIHTRPRAWGAGGGRAGHAG
jgi:hypothetical protein